HSDRLAQAIGEHGETGHAQLGEALQHLARNLASDHCSLQRIAVDEHGRGEGLEVLDAERVEDPRSNPREVSLAGCDISDDLLLHTWGGSEATPFADEFDPYVAGRTRAHPLDEIGHVRLTVRAAGVEG